MSWLSTLANAMTAEEKPLEAAAAKAVEAAMDADDDTVETVIDADDDTKDAPPLDEAAEQTDEVPVFEVAEVAEVIEVAEIGEAKDVAEETEATEASSLPVPGREDVQNEPDTCGDQAFEVGQRVECREDNDEEWNPGTVISINPLWVKPDDCSEAFAWKEVRTLQEPPSYGAAARLSEANVDSADEVGTSSSAKCTPHVSEKERRRDPDDEQVCTLDEFRWKYPEIHETELLDFFQNSCEAATPEPLEASQLDVTVDKQTGSAVVALEVEAAHGGQDSEANNQQVEAKKDEPEESNAAAEDREAAAPATTSAGQEWGGSGGWWGSNEAWQANDSWQATESWQAQESSADNKAPEPQTWSDNFNVIKECVSELLEANRSYDALAVQLEKEVLEMEQLQEKCTALDAELDGFTGNVDSCREHCQSVLGFTEEELAEAVSSVGRRPKKTPQAPVANPWEKLTDQVDVKLLKVANPWQNLNDTIDVKWKPGKKSWESATDQQQKNNSQSWSSSSKIWPEQSWDEGAKKGNDATWGSKDDGAKKADDSWAGWGSKDAKKADDAWAGWGSEEAKKPQNDAWASWGSKNGDRGSKTADWNRQKDTSTPKEENLWAKWSSSASASYSSSAPRPKWPDQAPQPKWPDQAPQQASSPQESTQELQQKIDNLKSGDWNKDWNDFMYWDDVQQDYVGCNWDDSLGRKGWWRYLWFDGKEYQPKDLIQHLEGVLSHSKDGGSINPRQNGGGKSGWDAADHSQQGRSADWGTAAAKENGRVPNWGTPDDGRNARAAQPVDPMFADDPWKPAEARKSGGWDSHAQRPQKAPWEHL